MKKIFICVSLYTADEKFWNYEKFLVRNLKPVTNWFNTGHRDSISKTVTVPAKSGQLECLLMLGIFLPTSLIFISRLDLSLSYLVFKTNLVVSIFINLAANLTYTAFLTTLLFTASLRLLESTGTVLNLFTSILPTSAFNRF